MAINTHLSTIKCEKQNKQAEQKQNISIIAKWERACRICGRSEGIKYKPVVTESSHGNTKQSRGNTVNNILITMYGVRWV